MNKRMFRRGKDDFAELTDAGELLLTPVKSSGTAENEMFNHPLSYLLNAPTGLTGRALHSQIIQDVLKGNRPIPGFRKEMAPQTIRSLINALGDQNAPQ